MRSQAWTPKRIALLMFPLVYLTVHGAFSFLGSPAAVETSSVSTASPPGGFLRDELLPAVAYSFICWFIILNGRGVLQEARKRTLFNVIAILAVVSILWSQAPLRSAAFGGLYLVDTLFAYYLITAFTHEQIRKLVMYAGFVIVISSILVSVLLPRYGVALYAVRDRGTWHGIFLDRTGCSKCVVFLLAASISFVRQNRWVQWTYVLLLLLLLSKARAVTALLVLVTWVTVLTLLAIYRRLDSKTRLFLAFNVLMVVTALSLFVGFLLPILLESLGRDMTFSGRTQIWGAVIDSVRKRPFLGYGFYGFWLGTKGESSVIITKLHWVFGYAHNGILEIAVQLGVVGVMLFLATLLQAIYHAWICLKTGKFTEVHFYISILLLTILYNIDEVTVLWPNDLLSILYIVACCGLARAADEVRLRDRASTHRKFAFAPRVGAKIAASKELM